MKKWIITSLILFLGIAGWYFVSARKFSQPQSSPTVATPNPQNEVTVAVPKDWINFKSERLGFSIYHPRDWEIQENGEYSYILVKQNGQPVVGPANFIYISVVVPEQRSNEGEVYNYHPSALQKLKSLKIGEHVSVADFDQPDLNAWFTYTRVDDTRIGDFTAHRYENNQPWEFPIGTTETRYIFGEDTLYIMGSYTGGENIGDAAIDPRIAHQIITSLRVQP
jgi:hypothetical protein